MTAHATIETGFYDDAGEWRRTNGPTVFGSERAPFGGWGSWDALTKHLARRYPEAVIAFGCVEVDGRSCPCPDLKHRFTLIDPTAFAAAGATS